MGVNLFNEYLKKTIINGKTTVINTVDIPAKIPICEFIGKIYTDEELTLLKDKVNINNVLQVGPNVYIAPSGNITDHIRHSCNSNCVLKVSGIRAILYSKHLIPANSQITFDYSLSSTDNPDSWEMECNCGSFQCRKKISGFNYLPTSLQDKYKKDESAASFIRTPIFTKKFKESKK